MFLYERLVKNTAFKFFFSVVFFFAFISISLSQCLDTEGIGSFDGAEPLGAWETTTGNNGSFEVVSDESYHGTSSLKITLSSDSNPDLSITNDTTCDFDITSDSVYTVSFYLKGTVGNEFTVTLMDGVNQIATESNTTKLTEWIYYTVSLNSNLNSENGRIKISFKDVGNYFLDELVLSDEPKKKWYVSPSGDNSLTSNGGRNGQSTSFPLRTIQYAVNTAWNPGDIIYVMNGTYRNVNYGTGTNNIAVVSINKTGTLNGPLIIRNYPNHKPKIEFDGAGGFICNQAKYLEISGFEIEGPNQKITLNEAASNRLNSTNYYKGRGIAIWAGSGGHNIILHSNKVYNCPGSGIRINNSDYCTISNNEIYNCTLWSSAGESALVIAQSKSIDNFTKIKMRITNNKVYNNVNKIRYFNSSYTCSNQSAYGCANYPNIIDGSGCYITRNNDRNSGGNDENPNGQYIGYFYFANNIAYGNGINGLVIHKSDYAIAMNNTCYKNGAVPISEGRQAASGITVNNSIQARLYNNISWTRNATDRGYQVFGATSMIKGKNNILINGTSNAGGLTNMINSDPLFVSEENFDFRLKTESPAINAGISDSEILLLSGTTVKDYTPKYDFNNNSRLLTTPDIGAFESVDLDGNGIADHLESLSTNDLKNTEKQTYIAPNPTNDYITIYQTYSEDNISIYNLLGEKQKYNKKKIDSNKTLLDLKQLKAGIYLVKITNLKGSKTIKLIKR